MSSSDSNNRPTGPPPPTSSAASTTSRRNGGGGNSGSSNAGGGGGRRRGGPGGPVPITTTTTNPRASNPLHLDLSGLRIDNDTESIASSSAGTNTTGSSRRRRRRRNNNNNNNNNKNALQMIENGGTGFGRIPPIPSSSKSGGKGGGKKPAKLQIGLNLDVELELKAKLGGDLTLSMVLEDRPKKRNCPELRMPGEGEYVATELFYMRVGTLRLRRRWIDPDAVLRGQIFLTALSAVALLACGFVLGWIAATAASGGCGGRGRGDAAMDILPQVSFGRGAGGGAGGGRLGFDESTDYHDQLASASSSSSLSLLSGPMEREEDGALAFGGGAGAGCNCDCERVRVDGVLDFNGIDLALGSLLGNVSSLYKY